MPKKTAAPESVRYLRTITGRSIPGPPPLLLGETNQAASKSANAIQEWLWRQAIIEAASRCDCHTVLWLANMQKRIGKGKWRYIELWTDAEDDAMRLYLFDTLEDVPYITLAQVQEKV